MKIKQINILLCKTMHQPVDLWSQILLPLKQKYGNLWPSDIAELQCPKSFTTVYSRCIAIPCGTVQQHLEDLSF